MTVQNKIFYMADGLGVMKIAGVSDPYQPEICSTLPTYHSAVDMKSDGRDVYTGDRP